MEVNQELRKLRMKLDEEMQRYDELKTKWQNAAEIILEKEIALRAAEHAKEDEYKRRILTEEKFEKLKQSTHAVSREFNDLIKELLNHFQNCCKNPDRIEALQQLCQSQLHAVTESVENRFKKVAENQNELNRKTSELSEMAAQIKLQATKVQIVGHVQKQVEEEYIMEKEYHDILADDLPDSGNKNPEHRTTSQDLSEETTLYAEGVMDDIHQIQSSAHINMDQVEEKNKESSNLTNIVETSSKTPLMCSTAALTLSNEVDEEMISGTEIVAPAFVLGNSTKIEQNEEVTCTDTTAAAQYENPQMVEVPSPCHSLGNNDNHVQSEKHMIDTVKSSQKSHTYCICGYHNRLKTNVLNHMKRVTKNARYGEIQVDECSTNTKEPQAFSKLCSSGRLKMKISLRPFKPSNSSQAAYSLLEQNFDTPQQNIPPLVLAVDKDDNGNQIAEAIKKRTQEARTLENLPGLADMAEYCLQKSADLERGASTKDLETTCNNAEQPSTMNHDTTLIVNNEDSEDDFLDVENDCSDWEINSTILAGVAESVNRHAEKISSSAAGFEDANKVESANMRDLGSKTEVESANMSDLGGKTEMESTHTRRHRDFINYKILHNGESYLTHDHLNSQRTPAKVQMTKSDHAQVTDQTSSNKNVFTCICGYRCNKRYIFLQHVRNFTEKRKFQCPICQMSFLYLSRLRDHKRYKHKIIDKDANSKGCRECGKTCRNLSDLMKHQKKKHCMATALSTGKDCKSHGEELQTVDISARTTNFSTAALSLPSLANPLMTVDSQNDYTTKNIVDSSEKTNMRKYDGKLEKTNMTVGNSKKIPVRVHFAKTDFACACNSQFSSKDSLIRHIARMARGKNFKCTFCPLSFYSTYDKRRHAKSVHKIVDCKPGFECQKCGIIFVTKAGRDEHLRTVHGTPTPSRLQTDETQKSPDTVWFHSKFYQPTIQISKYVCDPLATTSLAESETINANIKSTTSLSNVKHQVDNSFGHNKHVCTCGKRFSTNPNLKSHIRLKTQELKYRCELCNKRFLFNCWLQRHVEGCCRKQRPANAWEKSAVRCTRCESLFSTRSQLNDHMQTMHNSGNTPNQKNFKSQCLINSKSASNMKHKKDVSTGRNVYRCICKRKFVCSANLWSHIARSTLERKFQCDTCETRFLFYTNLKKHMKSVHKTTGLDKSNMMGCAKCGILFQNRSEFEIHRKSFHPRKYPLKK